MAYPQGWSVVPQIVVKRERWLSGQSQQALPLVTPGQEVVPDQPVLSFAPPRSPALVGPMHLPDATTRTAETLPAGLRGRVVEVTPRGGVVIESRVAQIQGCLGAGRQVAGIITLWQSGQGAIPIPPGALLVVPGPLNLTLLHQAAASGVVGVIASSIALRDLEGFLRTDLIDLLDTGDTEQVQQTFPLTLLLTEMPYAHSFSPASEGGKVQSPGANPGAIIMSARVLNLLSSYQGSVALLSGKTSMRQGILPELLISLTPEEVQQHWQPVEQDPTLTLGALGRVCGGEHAGMVGVIDYFFIYEQRFSSGLRTRALRLRLEDGSTLIVPRMLIERIG